MPNWITVRVKAKNPQVLSEKFLSTFTQKQIDNEENFTENGEELEKFVDFNKLIPTPSDLNIQSGACSYQDENNYFEFQKEKVMTQKALITPILERNYKEGMTQADFLEKAMPFAILYKEKFETVYNINTLNEDKLKEDLTNILKGFYNLKTYGSVDWYEFHYAKWGTKWNAQTTYVDEELGYVEFQTAWSCPFEILEELAKYTDIAVSYADEDVGSNFGVYTIINGVTNDLIRANSYLQLNNMQKVDAIATATVLTQGECYDIHDHIFGGWDDEELSQEFGMTKEEIMSIAEKSAEETQEVMVRLGLAI